MSSHRILLTGANGFVGSHILKQLLPRSNVSVRAVVRSQSKIDDVKHDFGTFKNLDFAIVPDITSPNAFNEALQNTDTPFDAVIHTASPFLYKIVSSNREFLDPAIHGTEGILKSIKAVAPSVKRVVVTSSFAAVGDFSILGDAHGKIFTDKDWNPVTYDQALTTESKNTAYQASKKYAEKAAWDFVANEKPNFDVVTINPPMIYGPLAHTVKDTNHLNESTARLYNLFINSKKDAELPPNGLYIYADAREVAGAHIAAVMTPEASNNRFVICAGQITSQQISDILRANYPELDERTPIGKPGTSGLPDEPYNANSDKAKKILGIEFRPLEDTVKDIGANLLEIEKKASNA